MAFKREKKRAEIEIISLVDVVFLLLIFFLLVTSFEPPGAEIRKELTLRIPKVAGEAGSKQVEATILIEIDYNIQTQKLEYYLLHMDLNPAKEPSSWSYRKLKWNEWPEILNKKDAKNDWSQPIALGCVLKRIEELKKLLLTKGKEPSILVRADGDMPYYPVLELTDFCRKLGLNKVSFTID